MPDIEVLQLDHDNNVYYKYYYYYYYYIKREKCEKMMWWMKIMRWVRLRCSTFGS